MPARSSDWGMIGPSGSPVHCATNENALGDRAALSLLLLGEQLCQEAPLRLLGEPEVAEEPNQRTSTRPHSRRHNLLDQLYSSTTGRSSIAPPIRAAGIRAASSSA